MALGIIICIVFLIMAALMMTKKMPTLLALPIMAVLIALIAGMPINSGDENLFKTVIAGGSTKLAGTYIAILIACWLSQTLPTQSSKRLRNWAETSRLLWQSSCAS